jgi:hypothetical protein
MAHPHANFAVNVKKEKQIMELGSNPLATIYSMQKWQTHSKKEFDDIQSLHFHLETLDQEEWPIPM